MNDEQKASLVRTVAKVLGGMAVGWATAKGYVSVADGAAVTDAIVGVLGSLSVIVAAVFSHKANGPK